MLKPLYQVSLLTEGPISSILAFRSGASEVSTKAIYKHLTASGIVCEYLATPDVVRISLNGLYTPFEDCYQLGIIVKSVLLNEASNPILSA